MALMSWILIFLMLQCFQSALSDDCSSSNIQTNLQQCLTSIWNKANDKSAFWFGTKWLSICGPNPLVAPYCTSLVQPYSPHSLLNTIYGLNWNLTQNPLTQYLNVTYKTTTGTYESCGNTYTITDTKTFDLEPLLSKNYRPWDTKTMPTITWTPATNTLYTLIIFDAGAYISHGVFINIEGTDIDKSEAIRAYNNPKNPSTQEQPYVFLLFEQTNRINLTDEWRQKLSQPMVSTAYNFTDVFQELKLKGPKAMNWVQVVRDPYSVQFFLNVGIMNECPNLVTEALKSKGLSFIPGDADLSLTLDIELQTTALDFQSCCTSYKYPKHTAKLNPLGNGYFGPGLARTNSTIKMTLQREGLLYIPAPKTDTFYTLVCVDIDVPNPASGTRDLPLLHMLVTNINGSDLDSGDVILSYNGPAPPNYLNHTYIFLLYRQSSLLEANKSLEYLTKSCSSGRCLFNVTRFVNGSNLNLVGASWLLSTTDEYVRYNYKMRGQNPDTVCNNTIGYANPCPVSTAHVTTASIVTMLNLLMMSVLALSV